MGSWIELELDPPAPVAGVALAPGMARPDLLYRANAAPSTIRVRVNGDEGTIYERPLATSAPSSERVRTLFGSR